jgi:hypothetical protein
VLFTVTVQDVDAPEGFANVHGDPNVRPLGVTVAMPAVPDGADGELPVSVTVNVQVLSLAAAAGDGVQDTVVDVGFDTVAKNEPLLVEWTLVGV